MRGWLAVPVAAGLCGCSAGACDPSQAGFISGIGCETSGAYNQRSVALQTQLSASRSAALQERANALEARQDATAAEAALAQRRQQLRTIDTQTAALQRRLVALQAANRMDQGQLARAQAEVAELNRRRSDVGPSPDEAALRELQQRQERLQAVIRSLGDM